MTIPGLLPRPEETDRLTEQALSLLSELIATPSLSRQEGDTANLLEAFLAQNGVSAQRHGHNVLAFHPGNQPECPLLLLNSHHDTVPPNADWQTDPYTPLLKDGRLYGLGSNDAGGPLVCLIATFLHLCRFEDLPVQVVLAATAEEEISGSNGVASILPLLPVPHVAIVGEPTQMHMAQAEKGLMVLDCTALGQSGHAARNEGVNAISEAMRLIEWFHTYRFERESALLGPIKMSVTMIQAGTRHNVVPATCQFTVDVRTTDAYTNQQTLDIICQETARIASCQIQERSTRLNPSGIDSRHAMVRAAQSLQIPLYGSPTLSDMALMPFPSVKIGPGDSARSHTANEYIQVAEIRQGIEGYLRLIRAYFEQMSLPEELPNR